MCFFGVKKGYRHYMGDNIEWLREIQAAGQTN